MKKSNPDPKPFFLPVFVSIPPPAVRPVDRAQSRASCLSGEGRTTSPATLGRFRHGAAGAVAQLAGSGLARDISKAAAGADTSMPALHD
jgi:hypothetical protein